MKKWLIVALFLGFFIGMVILFLPSINEQTTTENNLSPQTQTKEEKPVKKEVQKKKEVPTGSTIHFSLWEDEKNTTSIVPSGMDEIIQNEMSNTYKNHYFGYSFDFPSNWLVDHHLPQHYTRFYNQDFRLDVTYQNVSKAWTSVPTFITNTLEYLKPSIVEDRSWTENGFKFRLVEYTRPALTSFKDDLTNYHYAFISKGKIIYTLQLKSKQNHSVALEKELLSILKSFRTFPYRIYELASEVQKKEMNPVIDYKFKTNSLEIPKSSFMMGIYEGKSIDIHPIEKLIASHFGAQLFYKGIDSTYDPYFKEILSEKRLPVITFLFKTSGNEEQNKFINQRIINGEFDKQIRSWAQGVKGLESPILMRIGNEMNGVWSEWSHIYAFNDPDLYKLAYRHFVEIFKDEKANNVFFVWNPNENSDPYYTWNHASMYYPGDKYVDWVGMTAYNFGKTKWGNFRPFDTLYRELYEDYLISYSSKPLMIGEFGSVETGGSKANFIHDFFGKIPTKYPNVKMAIWFNEPHSPYDFSIDTSSSSLEAFKKGMQQSNVIKYLK